MGSADKASVSLFTRLEFSSVVVTERKVSIFYPPLDDRAIDGRTLNG